MVVDTDKTSIAADPKSRIASRGADGWNAFPKKNTTSSLAVPATRAASENRTRPMRSALRPRFCACPSLPADRTRRRVARRNGAMAMPNRPGSWARFWAAPYWPVWATVPLKAEHPAASRLLLDR
jgi:hypothetical protein